eukprot:g14246.t1
MGRSRGASRRRYRHGAAHEKRKTKRVEFPEFDTDDEQASPRRFSAADILGGRRSTSHLSAGVGSRLSSRSPRREGERSPPVVEIPPWRGGHNNSDSEGVRSSSNSHHNDNRLRYDKSSREQVKSGGPETARLVEPPALDARQSALRNQTTEFPNETGSCSQFLSPRAGRRRRRASWSSPRDSLRTASSVRDEATIRLSKNEGIRAAIERGWWPYLPLCWVVLNDKEVLKILPRQGYVRLFSTMYATLVPTAGEEEAEQTANWEYGEDAKGLPSELGRAGIPLGAFSDALFAVADNWTETVLAKDYIEFLDLLWKRVRPDLLFPPPPLPKGEKPPPIFSTTMFKGEDKKKTQRGRRNRRRRPAAAAAESSSSFPMQPPGVLENAAYGGGLPSSRLFGRPPPPRQPPPPRTPAGLLALYIPGFRPREAQRAAWVRKGGLIDPEAETILRPKADLGELGGLEVDGLDEKDEKEAGVFGWEKGGPQRVLAGGVVEERDGSRGRPGAGGRAGRKGAKENQGIDSVWDFTARNFSGDPREGDAFLLFVERRHPQLFDHRGECQVAPGVPASARNSGSGGGGGGGSGGKNFRIVRSYRSKEDFWARSRRKNVPKRVLEDLLAVWRAGTEGMTPAEYGAAFIGDQRASFLVYAIANGWGTRAGGVHSKQTLDSIAEKWRFGEGRCIETEILWEVLEDLLWEVADNAVDHAFSDSVDLYTIPHRLLYDPPQAHAYVHAQGRNRSQHLSFRQRACQRRASTAPASPSTTRGAMPMTTRLRNSRSLVPRSETGKAVAMIADNGAIEGLGVRGRAESLENVKEKGPSAGPAGRLLLQGEKVAGSVRQGQVAYYQTSCPTEKGACLEITLVSEGGGGPGVGRPPTPAAISLYAVQAPHRPLRLSLYTWASRGKTHHRLLLNWKGPPSSSWGGHKTHPLAEPQDGGRQKPSSEPVPIHIAVACPEPAPPPPALITAPAFDRGEAALLTMEGQVHVAGRTEAGGGGSSGAPLGWDLAQQGPLRRKRVKFSVGVKVVGPPRVVLEGRWYSLLFGRDTGVGTRLHYPLAVYATVRLPAPLKIDGARPGPGGRNWRLEEGEGNVPPIARVDEEDEGGETDHSAERKAQLDQSKGTEEKKGNSEEEMPERTGWVQREVTRTIEDPLVLRQLQFAHEFQMRFCATSEDFDDRIPVSGAGRACKEMHTRPFLLASKRVSPTQNEHTWRGVNLEGTVEVLRSNDGVEQVYTRYTETLKVRPNDGQYGTGRQRLAVDAGSTDCFFRILCWNREATAEDTSARGAVVAGHHRDQRRQKRFAMIEGCRQSLAATLETPVRKQPQQPDRWDGGDIIPVSTARVVLPENVAIAKAET